MLLQVGLIQHGDLQSLTEVIFCTFDKLSGALNLGRLGVSKEGGDRMARAEKVAVVEQVSDMLSRSEAVVLTDYRGLTVQQLTELRAQLSAAGVEYKVVKNTLTRLAAAKAGLEPFDEVLSGPTAIAFDYADAVAPAKILNDFAKDNPDLEIKGGLLNGVFIDADEVKRLASLPSREELLAKVLSSMQAPISGLVGVLHGTLRSVVAVIDAVRAQKEQQQS